MLPRRWGTAFGRFGLMAAFAMYYFAGAIHTEGRRRRGEAGPGDEFLFSHDPAFRAALWRAHAELVRLVREPDERGEAEAQKKEALIKRAIDAGDDALALSLLQADRASAPAMTIAPNEALARANIFGMSPPPPRNWGVPKPI